MFARLLCIVIALTIAIAKLTAYVRADTPGCEREINPDERAF